MAHGLGFCDNSLGSRVKDFRIGDAGVEFRDQDLKIRVRGSGIWNLGFKCRVHGFEFEN